jgi:hypothetical protein
MWCIYQWEHYSAIKTEGDPITCNIMHGPGGHYAKWNKPNTKRQVLCDLTYVCSTKKLKLIEIQSKIVLIRVWELAGGGS